MLKEQEQVQLRTQVETIVSNAGFYLVDLRLGSLGKYPLLKVTVAHELHDISLTEVTNLTHLVKKDPVVNELLPADYHLEVSSPGIDYPLKDQRDFPRNIGREIRVIHRSTQFPSPIKGRLVAVDADSIRIAANNEERSVKLSELEYAKLIVKF
jgi:ribosome maturation factor RimP